MVKRTRRHRTKKRGGAPRSVSLARGGRRRRRRGGAPTISQKLRSSASTLRQVLGSTMETQRRFRGIQDNFTMPPEPSDRMTPALQHAARETRRAGEQFMHKVANRARMADIGHGHIAAAIAAQEGLATLLEAETKTPRLKADPDHVAKKQGFIKAQSRAAAGYEKLSALIKKANRKQSQRGGNFYEKLWAETNAVTGRRRRRTRRYNRRF